MEKEFRLRTGRFEGLTNYQAELMRLRLLKPHRSFRLPSEELKSPLKAMEELEEVDEQLSGQVGFGGTR